MIDETHDPARRSWVNTAVGHQEFPIQNLPLGIFSVADGRRRPGVAIGDYVLDLSAVARDGLIEGFEEGTFTQPNLNTFFATGPDKHRALRRRLSMLLTDSHFKSKVEHLLLRADRVALHSPLAVGDYTDFYAGIHHAMNVGRIFRPDDPLLPNYKYIPIGYHGRASSIRVSGTPVTRPTGQYKLDGSTPEFGRSTRLDFELELGIWIGQGNDLGTPIPINQAEDHIAGFCLLNDWSARDIQAWEYQPLGPFLGKSFLTTISPWVVTADALAPFRAAIPARAAADPRPLEYLWDEKDQNTGAYAINLEAHLRTPKMRASEVAAQRISQTSSTRLYWTPAQLVAHHSSNGCNLSPGDLLGTGTISGPTSNEFGSLLELTRGAKEPLTLVSGETRTFLQDGDEITITGQARREGYASIGFGPCRGVVGTARPRAGKQ